MAVTRFNGPGTNVYQPATNAHQYVGVAADAKPTAGVPAGSTFIERDTGHTFIYDGTAWGQLLYPTSAA
jgi:hypothetical protein